MSKIKLVLALLLTHAAFGQGISGGGGGGAPSGPAGTGVVLTDNTVESTAGTVINLKAAPYYASGSGTTTTTSGTFAAGTSGALTSCASFSANQGANIAGAGAASADYIGTVVSCAGTTLTVTPATSTSVTNALVKHDDTAAFQAAVTAIASIGGKIVVPDGLYWINGALQDTGGANGRIIMPDYPIQTSFLLSATPEIAIEGMTQPPFSFSDPIPTVGAILQSDGTSGNMIGCYSATSAFAHFTSVYLHLKNLTFREPDNPAQTAVNAQNCVMGKFENLNFDTAVPVFSESQPTHTNGRALVMPGSGNYALSRADSIEVTGYYTGVAAFEHAILNEISLYQDYHCLEVNSDLGGHEIYGARVLTQHCPFGIVATGSAPIPFSVSEWDIERWAMAGIGPAWAATTYDVSDASNQITGEIASANLVVSGTGLTSASALLFNGAAKLSIRTAYPYTQPFWDIQNARLGIGTNTPAEALHIVNSSFATARLDGGATTVLVFAGGGVAGLGTTTATRFDLYSGNAARVGILPSGHVQSLATVPVPSACGTSPVLSGTDWYGSVTIGSGGTGCTLTFGTVYASTPAYALVNPGGIIPTISTTSITFSGTAGTTYYYEVLQ